MLGILPEHRPDEVAKIDRLIVARMLSGDLSVWDAMLWDYENDRIDRYRFTDRRLWSLVETMLTWRKHTIGGDLKNWVTKQPGGKVAGNAMRSAVADMLTDVGMFGGEYEYGAPGDEQSFAGWTLAELETIAALAALKAGNR